MRNYTLVHEGETTWSDVTLLELSTHAERYGITPEEFEVLTDMPVGASLKLAGIVITLNSKE